MNLTLDAIADALDPTKVFCFLPSGSTSHCNDWALCFFTACGVRFAPPGLSANLQNLWLKENWRQVEIGDACDAANLDRPVCVSYFNPTGHGHIGALMRGSTPLAPIVAAAGAHNFRRAPLLASFGHANVEFFLPKEP